MWSPPPWARSHPQRNDQWCGNTPPGSSYALPPAARSAQRYHLHDRQHPTRLGHGPTPATTTTTASTQPRADTVTLNVGTASTVILENAMAAVNVVPIPAEILRPGRSGRHRHRYVPGGFGDNPSHEQCDPLCGRLTMIGAEPPNLSGKNTYTGTTTVQRTA